MTMSRGIFSAFFATETQPPPSPVPPSPPPNIGPPDDVPLSPLPASGAAPPSAFDPHPCPASARAPRHAAQANARLEGMPSGRLVGLLIELASALQRAAAPIWLRSRAPAARVGRAHALARGALEILVAGA